ncbi:MAG: helix-turn-helix domain-containing protein, partial [Chloroflexota bacterium]
VMLGGAAMQLEAAREVAEDADAVAESASDAVREARDMFREAFDEPLDEYLRALGDRVQRLRGQAHWSQQKLAAECGLDRTYISALEHGRQNVSLGAVKKLADALGVRLTDLLAGDSR